MVLYYRTPDGPRLTACSTICVQTGEYKSITKTTADMYKGVASYMVMSARSGPAQQPRGSLQPRDPSNKRRDGDLGLLGLAA